LKAEAIYEQVTNNIIEALEAGLATGEWNPPWRSRHGFPHNAVTGKSYTGGNVIALWITEIDRSYTSSQWATYKQWASIGAQVRKGEHGTSLIKWVEPSGKRDRAVGGEDARKPRLVPVGFTVFNAEQVDGYTLDVEVVDAPEPIERAEAFFAAVGADVKHRDEGRAYYSIGGDYILLPNISDFKTVEGYYATLAHEHVHWTGAKSRLDRVGVAGTERTKETYAYEELIAEIGSAFLGTVLDITPELRDDHVQYLRSWLSALKNDHKLLFKAASASQKAVDFLSAFSDEKVEVNA
jgi:antirestriction protein ArdC